MVMLTLRFDEEKEGVIDVGRKRFSETMKDESWLGPP
jgi:hypothetical protein